ncbi:MAG: hypothetical protein HPY83_06325 [Anaerolineae bacterium]|nr:hypothetical protein [Anaerolineae bacterium]
MTRLLQVARSSLLALTRRADVDAPARPAPDPLGALWRLLEMPTVLALLLALLAVLVLSALFSPHVYLAEGNALGWPTSAWPAAFSRLAAVALLASVPWGQVTLGSLLVLSVVQAAANLRLGLRPAAYPAQGSCKPAASRRVRFYAQTAPAAMVRRMRLALMPLGYRLRPAPGSPRTFVASTEQSLAWARSAAAASLGALALLGLLAPKVTLAEVMDLEPGFPRQSQAGPLLLASQEPSVIVQDDSADGARPLSLRSPLLLGSVLLTWHGSGPALAVHPATADSVEYRLVIPFLPGQGAKYITVPETGASLRVSLTQAGPETRFEVQPLTRQGQAAGDSHVITEAAVVPAQGTDLALAPTRYQVVSALRTPLWWPGAATALVCLGSLGLALLQSGPPLTIALSERSGIVTTEVESYSVPAAHELWLRALRLVFR